VRLVYYEKVAMNHDVVYGLSLEYVTIHVMIQVQVTWA
jgi:hypothetical protein